MDIGEEKEISFEIHMKQLAFHDLSMKQVIEPGDMELYIGASSQDIRLHNKFQIIGEKLVIERKVFTWPMKIEQTDMNPWKNPEWMLLSYHKPATASSSVEGKGADLASDENVQTWWIAYFVIEDKSQTQTDLAHDLIVREDGVKARYIRCKIIELPYGQNPCISGIRVFGKGEGTLPEKATGVKTELLSDMDLLVKWKKITVTGYNVLWGFAPDKLYHSYMVFGKNEIKIGALIKGETVYVRVDTFNEVGIMEVMFLPLIHYSMRPFLIKIEFSKTHMFDSI